MINSDVVGCPLSLLFRHGQVNQFFTNLLSTRKKMPNGFKEFAYRNLECNDEHRFLNVANIAYILPESKL